MSPWGSVITRQVSGRRGARQTFCPVMARVMRVPRHGLGVGVLPRSASPTRVGCVPNATRSRGRWVGGSTAPLGRTL